MFDQLHVGALEDENEGDNVLEDAGDDGQYKGPAVPVLLPPRHPVTILAAHAERYNSDGHENGRQQWDEASWQDVFGGDLAQLFWHAQHEDHDESEHHEYERQSGEGLNDAQPLGGDPGEEHASLGREDPPAALIDFAIEVETMSIEVEADLPQARANKLLRFVGLPPVVGWVGRQVEHEGDKWEAETGQVD